MNRGRSLNIEHVSLNPQNGPEISRRPASTAAEKASQPTPGRRRKFTRKPDAGFIQMDIPATLLQSKVFNDGLDVRENGTNLVLADYYASASSFVPHFRVRNLRPQRAAPSLPSAIAKERISV